MLQFDGEVETQNGHEYFIPELSSFIVFNGDSNHAKGLLTLCAKVEENLLSARSTPVLSSLDVILEADSMVLDGILHKMGGNCD